MYTDNDGEIVVALVAVALVGYGIYTGLEEFVQQADSWGNAYGDVLNTAGDMNQKPGDYKRATDRFRMETQNLQKQTLKTALTMPGTSLTGPVGVPGSWKGLAFDVSIDKIKSWLYDHLIGIDSKSRKPGKVLGNRNATHWSNPLYDAGGGAGGGGGGAWGDPPSGGK